MDHGFFKKLIDQKINLKEEDVLEKILDRRRWPKQYLHGQPTVEAITEDGSKHQNFFHMDDYIDSHACIKCYEEGYTLILSNVGYFTKDTREIQNFLNTYFNREINCNFYFGNGKKSISFKKHNHDYAVVVKNIYGKSKWIIGGQEEILENQNCIGFDKFVDHEVIEIDKAKLSMTCNLNV